MQILNERTTDDGVRWQARIGEDRARLEVVAIVPASAEPTVVVWPSDMELRALLGEAVSQDADGWCCAECGARNPVSRRWCASCSAHDAV
jgi:hypothetical protein